VVEHGKAAQVSRLQGRRDALRGPWGRMPPEGAETVVDGATGEAYRVHRGSPPGQEGGS